MRLDSSALSILEKATARYSQHIGEAAEYLGKRAITEASWTSFRLGVVPADPEPGHELTVGRLAIPYITRAGVVGIKFRCMQHEDCKMAPIKHAKYLGLTGRAGHPRLYNPNAFFDSSPAIAVCEGEIDAMVLHGQCGIPAVGYPGTSAWGQNKFWTRCFSGYDRVLVLADGDDAGREAAKGVARSLDNATVIHLPDGEDTNSLYAREGAEGIKKRLGL